jgi:hypothetical protein
MIIGIFFEIFEKMSQKNLRVFRKYSERIKAKKK